MKQNIFAFAACFFSISVAAQINIQSGSILYLGGNAKIVLQDVSLINDGTITVAANGRFSFTGSANSGISGSQQPVFNELEIAKTGANKLILQRVIDVNGKIVFTSGLIDLNNNNINLGGTAILETESESTHIIGGNGGQLILITSLNAPATANPGNLGAIISSSQNLGVVIIRRGHQSQINGSGGGSSILRYYDILPSNNAGLNATLRFSYFDAELNSLDENTLTLRKSSNSTTWVDQGFTSRNTSSNYVEKTGIGDFSRWTLSSPGSALPVSGLVLSGRWRNNSSYLSWTTLAEYNNNYFDVERKYINDNNFISVGSKNSMHWDGNSQSASAYNWMDGSAMGTRGMIQYRLKQVDRNGQYTYSNIIIVKPDASTVFIERIYPTLTVKNSVYVQAGNLNLQNMQVQVYDMQGRLQLNKQTDYESQWLQLTDLGAGMYRIIIRSGEWSYRESFVKLAGSK